MRKSINISPVTTLDYPTPVYMIYREAYNFLFKKKIINFEGKKKLFQINHFNKMIFSVVQINLDVHFYLNVPRSISSFVTEL